MTTADLRVVMMVANDVTNDSRVRKEAAALAETGAEVTVLGVSDSGLPSRELLDGALIVRVAVPFSLREERKRSRTARRDWRPPLVGYRYRSTYVARSQRIQAELKELKADSGHAIARAKAGKGNPVKYKLGVGTRLLRRSRWQTAKKATWVRKGVGNKADGPFKFGWRAYDGVIHRLGWPAPWRKLHPEALDLEIAFGDLIDRIEPDVVHAHDMHVIGVAARAAGRAKLRGKDLKVVYDAHEYVAGLSRYGARTRRSIAAWANHEPEYIDDADRVITVSPADRAAVAARAQARPRAHRDHEHAEPGGRVGRGARHPQPARSGLRSTAAGLQRWRHEGAGHPDRRTGAGRSAGCAPGRRVRARCRDGRRSGRCRRRPWRSRCRTGCTASTR